MIINAPQFSHFVTRYRVTWINALNDLVFENFENIQLCRLFNTKLEN